MLLRRLAMQNRRVLLYVAEQSTATRTGHAPKFVCRVLCDGVRYSDSEVEDVMEMCERKGDIQPERDVRMLLQRSNPEMASRRATEMLLTKSHSLHSPLGSVLAQYKGAERHWAKEKVT